MPSSVSPLTLQFLEWVSSRPRTYAEVMEAWRTTCPRHSVWEDATIDGLVQLDGDTEAVILTPIGRAILEGESRAGTGPHRPAAPAGPTLT
jgi:hypothetical protein